MNLSQPAPAARSAFAASVEKRTIRKVQLRLIPFILTLFIFNVLDRSNVGFAALTMNRDLGISPQQFGFLAGIFFIGYFTFEVPSNLLLHKLGARIWIARILISWGIVASLTGVARTLPELFAVRFFLGVAEAGFFPGIILYLTYWFPQRERARPTAMFMTGLPIMLMFGAPVSGLILDHVHWLGLASWRWLLVLEGVPAAICGVLTYFVLPDKPETAKFLEPEERDWLCAELARENQEKESHHMSAGRALLAPRVWHLVAIYFFFLIDYYCINFWMPLEIKALSTHYSNTVVGLLVAIPNLLGLAAMVLVSYSSDRHRERRYHAVAVAVAGGAAMMLLGTTGSPILSIALLSIATMGIYSFFGPFWALPSEFLTGASAAAGIALVNSVANLGGFVGPSSIGAIAERSGSVATGMAVMGISLFISAALVMMLPRQKAELGRVTAGE